MNLGVIGEPCDLSSNTARMRVNYFLKVHFLKVHLKNFLCETLNSSVTNVFLRRCFCLFLCSAFNFTDLFNYERTSLTSSPSCLFVALKYKTRLSLVAVPSDCGPTTMKDECDAVRHKRTFAAGENFAADS